MKKHLPLSAMIVIAFASFCFAQPEPQASPSPKPKPAMTKAQMLKKLSASEMKLWEAWKNKDAKPFQAWLASDSVMVGESGVAGKAATVKEITSMPCEVKSYSLSDWKLTTINSGAALLTYKGRLREPVPARQYPQCGPAVSGLTVAGSGWHSRIRRRR